MNLNLWPFCLYSYLKSIPTIPVCFFLTGKKYGLFWSDCYGAWKFLCQSYLLVYLGSCSRMQRRRWHPTAVPLPGKSHGQRSLVGCSPWGRWGSDWATSLSLFTFMNWRRKWQPTPVFLPGESQGQGSLVGCRLWGRTELDMTEAT